MSMVLLCLVNKLTIDWVFLLPLDSNSDSLVTLVAGYYPKFLFSMFCLGII